MNKNKILFKLTSFMTIFFFLHACTVTVYSLKEIPKDRANEIKKYNIVVIHHKEFTAVLDKIEPSEGSISGYLKTYEKSENSDQLSCEIHLYISDDADIRYNIGGQTNIPLDRIEKVEMYQYDKNKAQMKTWSVFALLVSAFFVTYLALIIYSDNNNAPE